MNLIALKSPPFRAYLFTVFVSLNGFWAQRVIVSWLAWELTGSATFVGVVAFVNLCPTFICGPFFGVIADRVNVRRASMVSYSCVFSLSLLFAFIAYLELMMPAAVVAFSLGLGIVASANHPLRMSLTPRLAPVENMPSVIALTTMNFNVSRLLGPVIGGLLIQFFDSATALLLTASAHLPVISALALVQIRNRTKSYTPAKVGYLRSLADGFKHALSQPMIRLCILVSGLCAVSGRSVLDTLPILADGVFGKGPYGLGLMMAAAGVGALGASLTKLLAAPQRRGEVTIVAKLMAFAVPALVVTLGLVTDFVTALLITSCIGYSITMVAVSLQSVIQMDLDDNYRGRVMSFWTMITIGGGALGAMMMGLVGDAVGIASAQTMIGGVFLALVVLTLRRLTQKNPKKMTDENQG